VTGPGDLQLSSDRTGTTTFTVTNLTGRPVRVRLQPKSSDPQHDSWYDVPGDKEVPMTVGATISVDVKVKVPAGVAAGKDSLHLRAVDEADPEQLTDGQPVAVAIPDPPAPPKKQPFVLIAVIALVVLLVGGGAIWWFLLRKPAPPTPPSTPTPAPTVALVTAPAISGQLVVGSPVTTTTGTWTNASTTVVQWFACTTPTACTAIPGATGTVFQITGAQVGTQLKVTATATGPTGTATADTPLTTVVRTVVPNVATLTVYSAKALLTAYGLTGVLANDPTNSGCSPVAYQLPAVGTLADKNGVVQLYVTDYKAPNSCVYVYIPVRASYIPITKK
jgi:hypothetical protein